MHLLLLDQELTSSSLCLWEGLRFPWLQIANPRKHLPLLTGIFIQKKIGGCRGWATGNTFQITCHSSASVLLLSIVVRVHWIYMGFPGGSVVKNPPVNREMQVWSLGEEDPLEKEIATHSSILAWEIPWTEELGVLQSTGLQRVGHDRSDYHEHL